MIKTYHCEAKCMGRRKTEHFFKCFHSKEDRTQYFVIKLKIRQLHSLKYTNLIIITPPTQQCDTNIMKYIKL